MLYANLDNYHHPVISEARKLRYGRGGCQEGQGFGGRGRGGGGVGSNVMANMTELLYIIYPEGSCK